MKNLYAASMPCCAKVQDGMHEKVLGHEKHFWYEKHLRRHAVLYKRSRRQERRGMTYFQFIHEVEVKVREETEGNISVYIHSAVKNNGTRRHGLTLAEKGINIFPTIYLEEYYQQFKNGSSLETIAGDILRLYGEVRFKHCFEGGFLRDFQKIRGKIVYRLVNREANRELLEETPYEEYLDLAVVYYVLLEVNPYGMASLMIRHEHLKMWDVTQEEIACEARRNTRRLLPYEFGTMGALLEELSVMKEDDGDGKDDGKDIMYVLSNRIRSYGAAAILYESQLDGIGAYLEENYYVLPCSVHEVIIVPESAAPGREALDFLVREVNETQVDEEERLSNHAYYYDRQTRRLTA